MVELNTFFAKHFFRYPGKHWLCWGRILFLGLGSMPAIKQYYTYATDPRCKRLGNHAWAQCHQYFSFYHIYQKAHKPFIVILHINDTGNKLFVAIVTTETIVNIKFGYEELTDANIVYIAQWVAIMFFGAFVGLNLNYITGYNYFAKTGYPQSEDEALNKGTKKLK